MKKNRGLFFYYAILFLIMVMWTNMSSTPPAIIRIAFLAALTLPLINKPSLTPIILTLFLTTSMNSFSMSFMPAERLFYVLVLLLLFIVNYQHAHIKPQIVLVVLLFYTITINSIYGLGQLKSSVLYYSLIMVFMFSFFVKGKDSKYPHLFSYSFILTSLALSVLYLIYGNQFTTDYTAMERSYWMDPNYWGMVVGMGIVASFIELFYNKNNTFIIVGLAITIAVSILAIFLVASRGAILSVAAAFIIIMVASKSVKWVKVLAVFGTVLFVYWAYNSGYLDIFLYRVTEEGSIMTGAGRTDLWENKLKGFFSHNVLQWFVGVGNEMGLKISGKQMVGVITGFHNDYIAFLVKYGLIGLGLFIYYLIEPLKKKLNNRTIVLVATIYIMSCCFTLEPLSTGNFPYFAFIFYAYVWSYSPEIIRKKIVKNEK